MQAPVDEPEDAEPFSVPRARRIEGVGLGLRWDFLSELLQDPPAEVPFWEISPENYVRRGGYYAAGLDWVLERYPVVTHGLTLSIGAADPPSEDYLMALRNEVRRCRTAWHSDHLCMSSAGPRILHELLPVKQARSAVRRIAERIRRVQDFLGVPFALENITFYAHPGRPELSEAEFIAEILEAADCGLLLDVNNVYVNARNHHTDPMDFLRSIPLERVVEIHVAGHRVLPSGLLLDTHGAPVIDPVCELLAFVIERVGAMPVLLERDNDVPSLAELLVERRRIEAVVARALASHGECHAKAS